MSQIFIFAGTTEGREIAESLSKKGFDCTVSVATEYGAGLFPESKKFTLLQGRMKSEEMIKAFAQKNYACVVDATHPFATEVSKEIKKACSQAQIRYLRLARKTESGRQNNIFYFDSITSAADWLESQNGKIFVSTGSKELPELSRKISEKKRLVVRILPSIESLKICQDCKILQSQIIAMQGPFSEKTNELQFGESGAKILLTKESGVKGGYFEKIEAAQNLGMKIAVIENPERRQVEENQVKGQKENSCECEIFHSVFDLVSEIHRLMN